MMVSAREAKKWGPERLKGVILDAPIIPFSGEDGDEIDYDALRKVVRYIVGDLGHGLQLIGTVGEFWSLTLDERKMIVEVAFDEANKVNPNVVKSVSANSETVKDCVELTRHAQEQGADYVMILTPHFEAWGASGVYEYYKYVAKRTNIPILLYNSGCTGLILSPEDMAKLYHEIPAVFGVKNGIWQPSSSVALHELAPNMVIWECDLLAAGLQGLMKKGLVSPVILGHVGYLLDKPGRMLLGEHWKLLMEGKLTEAAEQYYTSGLFDIYRVMMELWICSERPGVMTHWSSGIKYMASVLGLPVGDYPYGRPPHTAVVPESFKEKVHKAYARAGFIKEPAKV